MHTNKWKVSTQPALGFGLTVVIAVTTAIIGTVQMRSLSGKIDELANDRMVKVEYFSDMKDNLNAMGRYVRNIVINQDEAFREAEKKKFLSYARPTAKSSPNWKKLSCCHVAKS